MKSKPGMLLKFKCVELNNFMKTISFGKVCDLTASGFRC